MVNFLVREASVVLQDVIVLSARGNGYLFGDGLSLMVNFPALHTKVGTQPAPQIYGD